MKDYAFAPGDDASLSQFFALEAQRIADIQRLVSDVEAIDADIDSQVLDLYGITDGAHRLRVLGSAPSVDEEDADGAQGAAGDEPAAQAGE